MKNIVEMFHVYEARAIFLLFNDDDDDVFLVSRPGGMPELWGGLG